MNNQNQTFGMKFKSEMSTFNKEYLSDLSKLVKTESKKDKSFSVKYPVLSGSFV